VYKQEKTSVKSMQEIGKACGEKWNTMAFEFHFTGKGQKRAEFEKAMIEYNKKKVYVSSPSTGGSSCIDAVQALKLQLYTQEPFGFHITSQIQTQH
ncbi:hypothetical protein ACJX0J_035293, partial [Zea mays]